MAVLLYQRLLITPIGIYIADAWFKDYNVSANINLQYNLYDPLLTARPQMSAHRWIVYSVSVHVWV